MRMGALRVRRPGGRRARGRGAAARPQPAPHRTEGDRDDHLGSAPVAAAERERLVVAVERGEPPPRIADARALDERPVRRQAHAVVGDAQHEAVAARGGLARRAHRERDRAALGGEPVLEGVLDERLQKEPWHLGGAERVGHVERHGKAVAEADLLDLEVEAEHVALLGEGAGGRLARLERAAQQLGELDDHRVRARRVGPHHPRDRVERVEEEVRPQLHAQRLEPRLAELRGHLRRLELARAHGAAVPQGELPGYEERADQHVLAQPAEEEQRRLRQVQHAPRVGPPHRDRRVRDEQAERGGAHERGEQRRRAALRALSAGGAKRTRSATSSSGGVTSAHSAT
jgi:hypothetical protein